MKPVFSRFGGAGLALAALLLAGLCMRVLAAWCYAATYKADHGIVCLMVKHLLEGGPIPIFYYGQAYLGAFEPWVSALLCAIFGLSGFWINMGTALVAFACLPLVYAWGKGAGGRTGGLAALAFCVVGPPVYFQFEGWAYGGYAAIPLLNCGVILVTVRLLARELRGETRLHGHYFLLGIVAGLGWWQSPLLVPAFLTSAFAFLAVLRARILSLRVLAGATGFFLASAPMWIWNWRHGWQTLDMLSTAKKPPFLEGLKLFYLVRLPELLEFSMLLKGTRTLFAALLILLVGLAGYLLVRRVRERSRETALYLGIAIFYALLMSILFTMSHYAKVNALRYELVMVPVLGVMIGTVTAWLCERTRWGLGWLPLLALITLQVEVMPMHFRERATALSFERKTQEMGAFLRSRGIRHVYADYQLYRASHGLNFMLDEAFVFSPHAAEKYKPYKTALELAGQPAVLNDMMDFHDFLSATLGTAETASFGGPASRYNRIELRYDIRPSAMAVRPVAAAAVAGVFEGGSTNRLAELTDESFSSLWRKNDKGNESKELDVRLAAPCRLAGVRLVCPERGWPGSLRVEGWDDRRGAWRELRPAAVCTRFFWSGPRFFWGGNACRLECRFDPVQTDRLRLRLTRGVRYNRCDIAEIQLLEPAAGHAPAAQADFERLAALLEERKIGRVYADRWEANRLYDLTGGRLRLSLDSAAGCQDPLAEEVTLDGGTALLVQTAEADQTRRVLAGRLVAARETETGPWTLFDFQEPAGILPHYRQPGLRWTGFGCLAERDGEWAEAAWLSAIRLARAGDFRGARALTDRALARAPANPRLALALSGACKAGGEAEEAERYLQVKERQWPAGTQVGGRLANGVELCGVSVAEGGASNRLVIRYDWRYPPGAERSAVPVYVHLQAGGRLVAQDDHVVEFPAASAYPGIEEAFIEGTNPAAFPPALTAERGLALSGPAGETLRLEIGVAEPANADWKAKLAGLFRKKGPRIVIPLPPRD